MKTLDELRDLAIRWALDYISHHQAQSRVNLDGIGSGLATAQRFEEESKRALDDALRELIADAERQPALLDVANRMCQLIPEGWELRLCMERGAAWVDLRNEAGDCIELPDPGDAPLHQQMERAVAISIEEDAYAASKG